MSKKPIRKEVDINTLEFRTVNVDDWTAFKPEEATSKDGTVYLRDRERQIVYRKIDGGYQCVGCDEIVMGEKIAHPIWDGPFSMSGSGRVYSEIVPYCPKCEEKPSYHGRPISIGPKF